MGRQHIEAALEKNDRSLAIAERITDMMDSPRYNKLTIDQIKQIAIADIDRIISERVTT